MDTVFDSAKKKTSKYIADVVLQQVIAAKTPEYVATLTKLVEDHLASPVTQKKLQTHIQQDFQDLMEQAVENTVLAYFRSKEFKELCAKQAKGLLK